MSDISYSVDALNVLNKFHRVDLIVHVEGDDDVVFWSEIFDIFSTKTVKCIPEGGSDQLDEKIELIEAGILHAIAARDSDYLILLGKASTNPRIIYTHGYSIENTLHTTYAIKKISKISSKTNFEMTGLLFEWLKNFNDGFGSLIKLDLANSIAGLGVEVLGDNCSRYMKNNSSSEICVEKIQAKEAAVRPKIPEDSFNSANSILDSEAACFRWVRGHFLASGVQKFISDFAKNFGKKGSMATDHLFSQSILCLSLIHI